MKIIGLTGNIACGKSAVCSMLAELGVYIIDCDPVAHKVMEPGTPAWEKIIARFGRDILGPNGNIDRAKLGQIVFRDPGALRDLEAITHPAVNEAVAREIASLDAEVVVVDAIKLIEAGMHKKSDQVWVVTCTEEQQVERLMKQRGMSREEALTRIRAQPPAEEKLRYAHVVIDNSGPLEETRRQVVEAYNRLLASQARRVLLKEGPQDGD